MKSAPEWLMPDSLEPHFGLRSHPDDYDPTDEELLSLIRAVQRDAIVAAAAKCREQMWSEDDVYAELVEKLLEEVP